MSEEIQRGPIAWEPWAAIACFIFGAVSLAIGGLLTTRWLLDEQLHPVLHGIGLILLIIGLPLIVLGGHCMDLQEKKRKAIGIVIVLFLAGTSSRLEAQQTIFNVPSTDVLDKGKVYAELDASLKPTDGSDVVKFSSFVPRVVVGVGSNVEITFAADWFTGKHAAGYFTPGIVFKAGPRVTGYAGYSIGNQNVSGGNHFFLLELGYNFN